MTVLDGTRPELLNNVLRIRWIMWLFLVSLHLITNFHRVSFNVVADLLTSEFNLTGAGLGNLAAAYTYTYLIMQLPGGAMVDRLGPRKIAFLSGAAMAAGSIIIGFSPNAALVFFGRLLIGFGGSVILINVFKFQASWFKPNEFATLSGLALFISSSGTLLASTPLSISVDMIGWRGSFILAGAVTVLVAITCIKVIRNRPNDPGNAPVYSTGPGLDSEPSGQDGTPLFKVLPEILRNGRLWMLFLINTGIYGGFIVFSGTWGISYLVHVYGMDLRQASFFIIPAFVGYMIGAPLYGFASDRLGSRKKPAATSFIFYCLAWGIIAAWPGLLSPVLLYAVSFFIGFGTPGNVLTFSMAREASSPGNTGLVTAMVNTGVFAGMAILQPLFGYVLDLGWEGLIIDGARIYTLEAYRLGFLICFLFGLMALVITLIYRENNLIKS